ncbi:MAG: hypothetical protein ACKVZ0_20655 [Gemmatimonadales bacterium]
MPRSLALLACLASCAPAAPTPEAVRAAIGAELARSTEATRAEDIDAYMDQMPVGAVIHDEGGAVITREQQRANILRDWAIIERTLAIEVVVDSLMLVTADSATVHTSQRWERLMYRRDGVTLDTVVTTQKHREAWAKTPRGWRAFEVEELGGTVTINGTPYRPE